MLNRWKSHRHGKAGAVEAKDLGRELEARIEAETKTRIANLSATFRELKPGWEDKIADSAAFIMEAASIRNAIRTACATGVRYDPPKLRFQASSLFLRDCWEFLTTDPNGNERLHLVTGTISEEGVRVMSRIVHIPNDEASPGFVRGKAVDTHKKIVELTERDGHPLISMFHSHIMRGSQSTTPSGIDIAHQDRFCAIGLDEVLGGIFSLDGYVRLFSTAHDFAFSIYGKNGEIISDQPREKIIKLATGG